MIKRRLLLGATLVAPFAARAQTYPSKPIRVILPGPVGGLIDIAGRAISDAMQRELGQPWMIDPRPGANGIMAGQMFLSAPSDGYTLFFTVSGIMALPFIMKVPFDTVTDFKPIAMVGISTALLCVPPQSPAGTVAEFVAYAKKNPGKLNYLNSGNGTGAHLLPELLKIKYGLDVTSISYKGLPPGVQDLLADRLDLGMVSTTLVMQHVKAGRLKALAVIGPERLAELPDVATMAEQGVGDIEVRSSLPLYGQKDLPTPIVERLNKAVAATLADPDTRKRLEAAFIQPLSMTPAEAAEAMKREYERLGALIKQLGIKADGS
jgi:tripartite-type tricarboxylate transporter receptor subunit TctC